MSSRPRKACDDGFSSGIDRQGHALDYTDTFTYDMAGNRSTLTHVDRTPDGPGSAGASFVITDQYDGDDRLVSETKDVGGSGDTADDTDTVYGYTGTDQSTQTVHQGLTPAGTVTQTTTYSYDATGHMTGVSITDNGVTTSVNYAYDANGVRVERTENNVRTVYLIDPDNATGYTQVLEQGVDANGDHKLDASEVQQAFTIGMRVLAQATATQVLKLLTDAHGSTRAVLDGGAGTLNAAAVLQHYVYSAFGSDLGLPSTPLTDLRYAGQMIDPLTGLSYNRARWYDPATGRFTQSDPSAGDQQDPITLNKYLYGNGNPITRIDPSGQFSLVEIMIAAGGGESLDKLQSGYRAEKGAAEATKFLVRIAFLEMAALSWEMSGLNGVELAFQAIYYAYEDISFEKRINSSKEDEVKAIADDPQLVQYIAAIPGAAEELDQEDRAKGALNFLDPAKKGKIFAVTFIPLTGNRKYDNYLSYATLIGFNFSTIIEAMENGTSWLEGAVTSAQNIVGNRGLSLGDFGQVSGRTWHHNEILGVMELLRPENHIGKGLDHVGAVQFWELLTGKSYEKNVLDNSPLIND